MDPNQLFCTKTLGKIAETIFSGGTPNTKIAEYWNGGIPWLSSGETRNRFITKTEKSITERGVDNSSTRLASSGDIVIASAGQGHTRGQTSLLKIDSYINQSVIAIRAKADELDNLWLFYNLSNRYEELRQLSDSHSSRGSLTTALLKNIDITYPPLPFQKAVGQVLFTLDEKIELNRQMNGTLEAMAQAIFKSWFVDFDPVRAKAKGRKPAGIVATTAALFPDSFQDSPLGKIPKGWRFTELGEMVTVIDCLHSKKPERRESGLPLLQLSNIRDDGLIDMTDTYNIDEADYKLWISRMEACQGDCVITNVGRVGAVAQIPKGFKAALGRNMTGMRCKSTFPFPTFLVECLLSEDLQNEIMLKIDTGTILDALNVRNIPKLRFLLPSIQLLALFEKSVRPLRAQMERNLGESRNLVTIRDMLLPKLLSGEIQIKSLLTRNSWDERYQHY